MTVGTFTVSHTSTLLMRGAPWPRRPSLRTTHFNPRSSCEERLGEWRAVIRYMISIHAPHARSDILPLVRRLPHLISIHAPHARSDAYTSRRHSHQKTNFNPRSSCEERPATYDFSGVVPISIHAPHARSDSALSGQRHLVHISIYAPHARCEERRGADIASCMNVYISIHAPHARSDEFMKKMTFLEMEFQSTLLMRGATTTIPKYVTAIQFQSTLLMRGATPEGIGGDDGRAISIHAPHARSDPTDFCQSGVRPDYFNPRSSCEERRNPERTDAMIPIFQSTLLMRGATGSRSIRLMRYRFQSTLLMRGATLVSALSWALRINFNPRSSCEERRIETVMEGWKDISIHAPHARSDHGATTPQKVDWSFQSTLLMRGATCRSGCEVRGCR